MVLNLPGDIVDCGVYRGASLFSWGNLIEIFAPHSQKVVIGFDTFSGFSSDLHIEEDRDHSMKLMEDRTRFLPRSMEEIMSVANTLNLSHRFRLISGDAVKTIPEFVQENRGLRFSLLNLDFDVYEPTAAAPSVVCGFASVTSTDGQNSGKDCSSPGANFSVAG
jgi:hypothetical protein